MVEHTVRDRKVASSSLATPTYQYAIYTINIQHTT